MLRAITFDFWATLYQNSFGRDERLQLLSAALTQAGQAVSHEALLAAYDYAWKFFDRIWLQEHRPISTEDWMREMLSFLGAELSPDRQAGLYGPLEEVLLSKPPVPVPGVTEVVPRLARRFALGLISDVGLTPGRVMREFLRRDGLLPYFQALTFSNEVGMTKPLPGMFLRTLESLGAAPSEAVHIGDLPETDIAGAKGVGMRAILFLGISHREDGRVLADAAVEDYSELEAVLERL